MISFFIYVVFIFNVDSIYYHILPQLSLSLEYNRFPIDVHNEY